MEVAAESLTLFLDPPAKGFAADEIQIYDLLFVRNFFR